MTSQDLFTILYAKFVVKSATIEPLMTELASKASAYEDYSNILADCQTCYYMQRYVHVCMYVYVMYVSMFVCMNV